MKCVVCGEETQGKQKTCSSTCRSKLSRGEKFDVNKDLKDQGLNQFVSGTELPELEFVSSQIPEIDEITGGFPRKRITEIFGMKAVGKTSLMAKVVSNDQKVLYIDTESALSDAPENVKVVYEDMVERVMDTVFSGLKGDFDLIVVDSVASMTPRAEIEGESGDAVMGLKARLMGQFMRKVTTPLMQSDTAMVFINQERESLSGWGAPTFTPGGRALPYAASLRLKLSTTKADRIVKDGQVVGHWVNFEVEKSRICKPFQKGRFKLLYE